MRRLFIAALVLTSCGGGGSSGAPVIDPGDSGTYRPTVDPANFVATIDNPYLPFTPGRSWVYECTVNDQPERVEVVVTSDHKTIVGISTVVVRDTVTSNGVVTEDTLDFYAQDRDGNVWYLGEDTKEYENGKVVSTKGTWEAGVDGAQPGYAMPAAPTVGSAYRQEFYRREAEDMAEVVRVGDVTAVPAGRFDDLVVTKEWTPLEPKVVEEKSYARGVGMVQQVTTAGGTGEVHLVSMSPGG